MKLKSKKVLPKPKGFHPEIKHFFESINRISSAFSDRSDEYYVYYLKRGNDPFADEIAYEYYDNHEIQYIYNDELFSEQEMLSFVRLKAFW